MKIKNKIWVIARVLIFSLLTAFLFWLLTKPNKNLPYEQKIEQFLNSLQYSALNNFNRDDFYIQLDFKHGLWVMKNIFSYDQQGELINHQTRNGTCAELSQVTYNVVKPLFKNDYRIIFLKGNEETFFSADAGIGPTHYIIKIIPKKDSQNKSKVLAIDPSYKVYNYFSELKGYTFSEEMNHLDLFTGQSKDLTMKVGVSYPLLLLEESDCILSLAVKKVHDKYNQDNFALTIFANKKNDEISEGLFALMMREGDFFAVKNEDLISKILDENTKKKLSGMLLSLFKKISFR
jgi:hypothetical protein